MCWCIETPQQFALSAAAALSASTSRNNSLAFIGLMGALSVAAGHAAVDQFRGRGRAAALGGPSCRAGGPGSWLQGLAL